MIGVRILIPYFFLIVFLSSCGGSKSRDSIDGEYNAIQLGYLEEITLEKDGTYEHSLSKGGSLLFKELGKWRKSGGQIVFEDFTQAYDPMTKKISSDRKKFFMYKMSFFYVGNNPFLKPAADQDYLFMKKSLRSAPKSIL